MLFGYFVAYVKVFFLLFFSFSFILFPFPNEAIEPQPAATASLRFDTHYPSADNTCFKAGKFEGHSI